MQLGADESRKMFDASFVTRFAEHRISQPPDVAIDRIALRTRDILILEPAFSRENILR